MIMCNTEKLWVDLGENSYNIIFDTSFDGLAQALETIGAPQKLLIITDTNVDRLYGEMVLNSLRRSGYDVQKAVFPAGERYKRMDTILDICRACVEHQMDRKSMILALGGGVVGDMAGFAAAIYMRGIRFVQLPTTLLSQSDSSVGGKTGIDFMDGKNILGSFHQPSLVYMNVDTLKTLPVEEFISGMGEVIKHGVIRDAAFFQYLAENREQVQSRDSECLIHMAKKNCAIKAAVVTEDEKENGLRAILNFGHTAGHAIESAFDFSLTHGACVGIGMIVAAKIAMEKQIFPEGDYWRLVKILEDYGFPIHIQLPETKRVMEFMKRDKKVSEGRLKFILPERIGSVTVRENVTEDEIKRAFYSMTAEGLKTE